MVGTMAKTTSIAWLLKNQTIWSSKSLYFECFCILNGWISDPQRTLATQNLDDFYWPVFSNLCSCFIRMTNPTFWILGTGLDFEPLLKIQTKTAQIIQKLDPVSGVLIVKCLLFRLWLQCQTFTNLIHFYHSNTQQVWYSYPNFIQILLLIYS